jgi:hypothetical protein
MKKPTLTDALAVKTPPPLPVEIAPEPKPGRPPGDGRVLTSLRLPAETLMALKMAAVREQVKVNDLVLEGIDHVLRLRQS